MKNTNKDPEYQIAVSFAKEDRVIVDEYVKKLQDRNIKVFYDKDNQSIIWGKNINQYLSHIFSEGAKYCVIFVSANYKNNPWAKHELSNAQSRESNQFEEYILPIIIDDSVISGISDKAFLDTRVNNIDEIVQITIDKLNSTLDNRSFSITSNTEYLFNKNKVLSFLHDDLSNFVIDSKLTNEQYGFISTISDEKSCALRKILLNHETKKIIIVGSSLCEAFNSNDRSSEAYIGQIISKKISSKEDKLQEIQIFITDPVLLDEEIHSPTFEDSPLKRIDSTLTEIAHIARGILPNKILKVFFIPMLQIDHLVITDKYILSRNTMLWTGDKVDLGFGDNEYQVRGSWFLGKKTVEPYSIYNSYERYLQVLIENSIKVSLDEEFPLDIALKFNSRGTQSIYKFRNGIRKIIQNKIDNISIHKLYKRQLISYIRSTWTPQLRNHNNEITWENESKLINPFGKIRSVSDLQNPETLLKNDNTQRLLLPFVKKTEDLLDEVVKKYDKEGFAKIIPSLELGVPNNVQRLAGGFATGSLVLWKCGTPIIPIDTTVNVCTSSVFEIFEDIEKGFTLEDFERIKLEGLKEGHLSNFEEGNHFIVYGHNPNHTKHFLVLHSSAKEFKYSTYGLYPHQKSWFYDKIKTHISKDQNRYLRYIKDEDAVNFANIVQKIDVQNIDTHHWFAEQIAHNYKVNTILQKHHYFMPSSNSVAIGAFVVNENDLVPIFSDRSKEIVIIKAKNKWSVNIGGKSKLIIPHGWGQEFKITPDEIHIDRRNGKITIGDANFEINEKASFVKQNIAKIRDFKDQNEFLKSGENYLDVLVTEVIIPEISISKHGYERFT